MFMNNSFFFWDLRNNQQYCGYDEETGENIHCFQKITVYSFTVMQFNLYYNIDIRCMPYQLLVLSLHTSNDLHKLRASHCQEGHLSLGGYSLGQQSFPTAWRPEQ